MLVRVMMLSNAALLSVFSVCFEEQDARTEAAIAREKSVCFLNFMLKEYYKSIIEALT
jgi:hypothetical protein